MSILNQKSRESRVTNLVVGEHLVTVSKMIETDDCHKTFDSAESIQKDEWVDATPQLAIVFTSPKGIFTHRFNVKGFMRFDELSEKQQKACYSAGDAGYAVNSKTKMRVEDADRTDKCFRILDDMSARCGLPVGSEYNKLIGKELVIVIDENAQGNLRIVGTKKASALKEVEVEEPINL